ncbi:hypothetical protein LRS13_19870 [Svornostia abyssi]|uniref:Uncharacterized protein n=1 Tax=Svornostia abyssi TaxID=2898438 RepID=A0ABY5PEI9_9ACTN|nr:hypothetical protein LRS13_19870 [Parviterribacteraceae bacterium J379]
MTTRIARSVTSVPDGRAISTVSGAAAGAEAGPTSVAPSAAATMWRALTGRGSR